MNAVALCLFVVSVGWAQSQTSDEARTRAARLFAEGRFVEVKALALQHLTESRPSAPWWIIAAEVHLELEEFEAACHHFRRAHTLDATLDSMMVRYGLALVRIGQTREAAAWLQPFLVAKDPERRSTAMYFLALSMLAEGQSAKARTLLQDALLLTPKHARLYVRLAQLDLEEGRFDHAVAHADMALRLKPLSVAAAHTKAIALGRLHKTAEARTAFAYHRVILDVNDKMSTLVTSLATSPDPAHVCLSLAELAQSMGERDLTLAWAGRALVHDPESAKARALVALLRAESRPTTRRSP